MENWRELFKERFVIEENVREQYLRKYDHRTIVEELEHFIEQEIEKARGGVFTQAERNHLLTLLEERKKGGCYYGNREQYYKRTDRLISKLTTK
jgi:hypothetical protein